MNNNSDSLNGLSELQPVGDLVCFDDWLRSMKKTRVTGWNYRKRGWIETVNIAGRVYVSRKEIARFELRAQAGEFARYRVRKGISPSVEESPVVV